MKPQEAIQWTGDNASEVAEFLGLSVGDNWPTVSRIGLMDTRKGYTTAVPGDRIATGSAPGDFYAIKELRDA